jgi:hypothetical protein
MIKAFVKEQIRERGAKFWTTIGALIYIGASTCLIYVSYLVLSLPRFGTECQQSLTSELSTLTLLDGVAGMFSTIDALILKLVIDNALGKADDEGNKDPRLALWLALAFIVTFGACAHIAPESVPG